MRDFFETRVLGWVFGFAAGLTLVDVIAFGTGLMGLLGAAAMAASGWYSFRINRSRWKAVSKAEREVGK